jgi:E3 ubiquitin-protein ligase RAD18
LYCRSKVVEGSDHRRLFLAHHERKRRRSETFAEEAADLNSGVTCRRGRFVRVFATCNRLPQADRSVARPLTRAHAHTSLMDSAYDVPDSTDWLNTPLALLSHLESALHCQICKEFYDTPMITSCSHTFCSRCIRTSLSADGRCPACRASDQASKLRNNWQLQEVVSTFLAARPQALKIAREERDGANEAKKPAKRKRAILDSDDIAEAERGGRTTRSKSRRTIASQSSQQEPIEVDDSDEDGSFEPEKPQDDGLIECPLGCGKRMKIEAVEPHLDRCEEEKEAEKKAKSRTHTSGPNSSRASQRNIPRPQDRISELNYSLLKETAMRKKMDELGLPSFGGKQLMVRRHTEWVNLWNANCDSSNARSKRELLHDLDTWERTMGGRAPTTNQGYGIMRKDFDGNGWANKNKDDFSRLIADARRKKTTAPTSPDPDQKAETQPAMAEREMIKTPDNSTEPSALAPDEEIAQVQPSVNLEAPPHLNGSTVPFAATSDNYRPNAESNAAQQERTPPATGQDDAVLPTQNGIARKESHDYHVNQHEGTAPCELPSHLATSSVRKVPMFSLPQESSRDQ